MSAERDPNGERRVPFRFARRVVPLAALTLLVAGAALSWRRFGVGPRPAASTQPGNPGTSAVFEASANTGSAAPPADRRRKPCARQVVARGDAAFVDDFEDGNARIPSTDSRMGFWYVYKEGTGRTPVPNPSIFHPTLRRRAGSRWAMHIQDDRFAGWGSAVGVRFVEKACYDVSAYAGVRFWARGRGRLQVALRTVDLMEPKYAGQCHGDPKDCNNLYMTPVRLTAQGAIHEARWAELVQREYSEHQLDLGRVVSLEFVVLAEDSPFDVWLDDIAFLEKPGLRVSDSAREAHP